MNGNRQGIRRHQVEARSGQSAAATPAPQSGGECEQRRRRVVLKHGPLREGGASRSSYAVQLRGLVLEAAIQVSRRERNCRLAYRVPVRFELESEADASAAGSGMTKKPDKERSARATIKFNWHHLPTEVRTKKGGHKRRSRVRLQSQRD